MKQQERTTGFQIRTVLLTYYKAFQRNMLSSLGGFFFSYTFHLIIKKKPLT